MRSAPFPVATNFLLVKEASRSKTLFVYCFVKIDFSAATVLYFAAIVLGIFSAAMLFLSNKNKLANRLLAFLELAIAGWLLDAFFRVANIYGQNPNLYFLPIYYSFAFGPLVYLYAQAITNASFKFTKSSWLHFVPVFIQAVFYWIVVFQSYQTKYNIWFNLHLPYTYRLEYDGTWISLTIYLLLSVRLIRNYQNWLNNNYADVTRKTLNWLKICLLLMVLVCVCWLVEAILRDAQNVYYKYNYSGYFLCAVIFMLGIFSYQQANINLSFEPEKELPPQKAATVLVDDALAERIQLAMQRDQLYLNPELTLADLAKHLAVPAKTISATINAAFDKPFNSYVNTFRVEAVKKRFLGKNAERLNLLGIAFESGFNSKTSFNRIFKDLTGFSPSQYLKK